jgi:hypothetical protein
MKAGVQIRLIPGQKAGRISDGSPTNGGVTGRNPATQTKQQTAQMPMNSTIAAQTAQQSIDGGGVRTPSDSAFFFVFMGIGASLGFAGVAR